MIKKFGKYLNENVSNKLNETIINPNFSVVVPGGCNAKCDFCFSKLVEK
jgi:tRNA A37 methylthiotransferase MiaB